MSIKENYTRRQPLLGQSNNALVLLFAINALIFVALNFLKVVYFLSYNDNIAAETFFHKQILDWFTLPASLGKLIIRPWTIVLYMFSHYSVWGLISTVLWLWAFGYLLQDLTGNKKIFPIYLYGGFAGAVAYLLSVNLIPAFYQNINIIPDLIGGGAAVMAVAIATTTLAPDYRLFPLINGGIPIWVLTVIFVAIDYASVANSNGAYAIAHLAGGAIGFIFVYQLRKGKDMGKWMNDLVDWFNNLFNPDKKNKIQSNKEKLFYKSDKKPFLKTSGISQQKLDEILDKINQDGYHTLSSEEKEYLKRASKEEL
jgi:membrane associated rhomboid family serine protease